MNEDAHSDIARPANVACHLPAMAERLPDGLAVAVADGKGGFDRVSFVELNRRADRMAHGFSSIGIGEGTRTVLMVKPSPEFFALTFALFKLKAVPVLVDPGMGIKNLGQCLAEAEPEAFIGIPKAHAARLVLRWARSVKTVVTVGPRLLWGGHSLAKLEATAPDTPFSVAPTSREDMAAILFTSGSTGVPKGAVYSHGIFSSQVDLLRQVYGIEPGELDLSTFPLFALFGPALGMASIVPDMDASKPAAADPAKLVAAVREFSCTNMFASPALIEKIGRYGVEHDVKLPTLRRVISAGAPARPDSLERFVKILGEGVEVFTPYGATESLPVANVGSTTILGETRHQTAKGGGVCVGTPVEGMEVVVIGITDDPIPQWSDDLVLKTGEVGEIVVKGPVVTRQYWGRDRSTKLAKIADGDAVRHRMGDVGYYDEQGRLWMCGRKSHRVETTDGPMFTVRCEAIFNEHPDVYRTALVGLGNRGEQKPVLCVEREKGRGRDGDKLIAELRALGKDNPLTENIDTFLLHDAFPVDVRHNAKIFREQLTEWASKNS